ncbi:unnamed protein product [Fraxinus pennsylvanica]|uniref:Gnk2-homologous domain-containing protein n=1 Tax=Fraxinus pennsylvanica TaxID=56036 RepID=A0AAD2AJZ5_9LAMI|nr:unnamed protein product [Fraxinus pennsylvanica]
MSNSTYSANLNCLLSSVSSNTDTNGFYNASMGEYADRVNAIALCRGDVQLDIVAFVEQKILTSPEEFNWDLTTLLNNLHSQAAFGGSLKKFAAANRTGPDSFDNLWTYAVHP